MGYSTHFRTISAFKCQSIESIFESHAPRNKHLFLRALNTLNKNNNVNLAYISVYVYIFDALLFVNNLSFVDS